MEALFALQAIEVLCERTTSCTQVMPLNEQHSCSVYFIERVEYSQKISWVPMRRDGKEIAEGWRKQGVELLFGENFEERWLLLIEGAPKGCDKLHCVLGRLEGVKEAYKKWQWTTMN
jgi:hypothetical protein